MIVSVIIQHVAVKNNKSWFIIVGKVNGEHDVGLAEFVYFIWSYFISYFGCRKVSFEIPMDTLQLKKNTTQIQILPSRWGSDTQRRRMFKFLSCVFQGQHIGVGLPEDADSTEKTRNTESECVVSGQCALLQQ